MTLRPASAADLDAILALERATEFAPHWSRAAYQAMLAPAEPHRCLLVAELDGRLAGFAAALLHPVQPDSSGRAAELESVVVAAANRRSGIGRELCRAVIERCRRERASELVLEVRAASVAAIALYTSLGFAQRGRRPRYYRDPEDDALLMQLPLRPSRSGPATTPLEKVGEQA